jgi:uncharacterized protein Smg (DUF494 family)
MRSRILEIVILMVDYIQEKQGQFFNAEELSSALKTMGYTDFEISSAYSWLVERFDNSPEEYFSNFPKMRVSNRVLTDYERRQLTPEAHSYLLRLLNMSLVDQEQFEAILERASLFAVQPVTLDQMKLIVSSVLFRDVDDLEHYLGDESEGPSTFVN